MLYSSLLLAFALACVSAQTEPTAPMLLISGPPDAGVVPINLADMAVGEGSGTGGSWLTLSPDGSKLYVTDENASTISAFSVDEAGALTALGEAVPVGGTGPVHSALSPDGTKIYTGQYTAGSVSEIPLGEDGSIGTTAPVNTPFGTPETSKAHSVVVDPSGQFVVIPDLGLNQIHVAKIGADGLEFLDDIESPPLKVPFERAPGPRHAAFSLGGENPLQAPTWVWLHVGNEVSNTVDTFSICYADDGFKATLLIAGVPTIPTPAQALVNQTDAVAEVLVTRNSKWLLVSNRRLDSTEGSIAVFSITNEPGLPIKQVGENVPSGGIFPRGMALSADDSQLAVVNGGDAESKGVSLQMFDFDAETGALTPKGEPITEGIMAPSTVVFKESRKVVPIDLALLSALKCQEAPKPVKQSDDDAKEEPAALEEIPEGDAAASGPAKESEEDVELKTLRPADPADGAQETDILEEEVSGSGSSMETIAEETGAVAGKKVQDAEQDEEPAVEDDYDVVDDGMSSGSALQVGSLALGIAAAAILV